MLLRQWFGTPIKKIFDLCKSILTQTGIQIDALLPRKQDTTKGFDLASRLQPIAYHLLVDSESFVVLAISPSLPAIVFLNECIENTFIIPAAQYPNYMNDAFCHSLHKTAQVNPENNLRVTWNRKARAFVHTRPHMITEELKSRARLANSKLDVITKIMISLSRARSPVATGVDFQETVYLTKKAQAKAFKDSGYDEERLLEFPYVLQYMDFAKVSSVAAADEILFKAALDDQLLANTELTRLRYFKKIKEASSAERIAEIYIEFLRDMYRNAEVS